MIPEGIHIGGKFGLIFASRLILLFVSVIINFAIYFKTKEIYELTEHKGIKYFREGFLFLAIANILGFFVRALWRDLIWKNSSSLSHIIFFICIFIAVCVYFLGLLNLFYSLTWKKYKNLEKIKKYHLLFPIILLLFMFGFKTGLPFLIVNAIFVITIFSISLKQYFKQRKKKFSFIAGSYILLIMSWFLTIMTIRMPLPDSIKMLNSTIGLALYFGIYYKVHKELSEKK